MTSRQLLPFQKQAGSFRAWKSLMRMRIDRPTRGQVIRLTAFSGFGLTRGWGWLSGHGRVMSIEPFHLSKNVQ